MKPEDLTVIEVQHNAQNMCTPTNVWQTIKSVCYRHAHVKKSWYRQTLFYMGEEERMAEKKKQHYMPIHIYTNVIMHAQLYFDIHIYMTIYNFASF